MDAATVFAHLGLALIVVGVLVLSDRDERRRLKAKRNKEILDAQRLQYELDVANGRALQEADRGLIDLRAWVADWQAKGGPENWQHFVERQRAAKEA